jgi:hypothetical protein
MYFHLIFLMMGLVTIVLTLASLRRDHIRPEFSVSWLVFGAVVALLAFFPGMPDRIARAVGLDPALCFTIGAGMLVAALVFEMSHTVSRLRDENVILAQRVAILEFEIRRAIEGKTE